jgi:hypothetical protein
MNTCLCADRGYRCGRTRQAAGRITPAHRWRAEGAHDRFRLVGPRDADPQREISDSNPADVATPLERNSGRRRRATDPCVM